MKKVIFLSLLLVMSLSVANAVQRAKPSSEQIKKLIKKMLIETKITTFAGINSAKDVKCKNIKIKKINILKIGKTSSNYYINSGSNVSSDFKVKFSIQGSCNLTSTFRVNLVNTINIHVLYKGIIRFTKMAHIMVKNQPQ